MLEKGACLWCCCLVIFYRTSKTNSHLIALVFLDSTVIASALNSNAQRNALVASAETWRQKARRRSSKSRQQPFGYDVCLSLGYSMYLHLLFLMYLAIRQYSVK